MTSALAAFLGSAALLIVLCLLLAWLQMAQTGKADAASLLIYCGAGIRASVEVAAAEYEKEHGVHFTFRYGPSQVFAGASRIEQRRRHLCPRRRWFH
jgi:ABC-type molybdate transport system substrate-binding protein